MQGIQIFKPKTNYKKNAVALANAKDRLENLSFQYSYSGPPETIQLRHSLYQTYLKNFECKVNIFEIDEFKNLIDSVFAFVQGNYDKISKNVVKVNVSSIVPSPVGILFNGLSPDENKDLMDSVVDEILGCFDSYEYNLRVARICSGKCGNVKLAFQNICKAIIVGPEVHSLSKNASHATASSLSSATASSESDIQEDSDSGDSDSDSEPKRKKKKARKPKRRSKSSAAPSVLYTVNDLKNWITNHPQDVILIVIDDVDLADRKVICGLLQLLRCCKLPSIYLFGIIHNFIPAEQFFSNLVAGSSGNDFKFEQLYSVDPVERLQNFIEKIAFDLTLPVRVSGPILRLMIDYYNFYQFSIKRLIQAYRLTLIEHFTMKSETIFCRNDIKNMWIDAGGLGNIPDEVIANLIPGPPGGAGTKKPLPSTPTKSPRKKSRPGLEDLEQPEIEMKEKCQDKLILFNNEIFEWHAALRVVFSLGADLPDRPIGNSLNDLYISAWDGTLFEERNENRMGTAASAPDQNLNTSLTACSPFDQFISLINHFSQSEMELKLHHCITSVQNFIDDNSDSKLVNKVEIRFLAQMKEFLKQLQIQDQSQQQQNVKCNDSGLNIIRNTRTGDETLKIGKNQSLGSLKEVLLEKIQGQKSLYDSSTKQNILRFLKTTIKSRLKKIFGNITFSSVFILDNVSYMRAQLLPNLSKELHVALANPGFHLRCECCSSIPIEVNSPSLPDTSILYKLYSEQTQKNVNLNDLYFAFKSFFELTVRRKVGSSKKAMEKEHEFLHRFRQALIELQYLGFLKRNRGSKRTDEAVKLCWIFS